MVRFEGKSLEQLVFIISRRLWFPLSWANYYARIVSVNICGGSVSVDDGFCLICTSDAGFEWKGNCKYRSTKTKIKAFQWLNTLIWQKTYTIFIFATADAYTYTWLESPAVSSGFCNSISPSLLNYHRRTSRYRNRTWQRTVKKTNVSTIDISFYVETFFGLTKKIIRVARKLDQRRSTLVIALHVQYIIPIARRWPHMPRYKVTNRVIDQRIGSYTFSRVKTITNISFEILFWHARLDSPSAIVQFEDMLGEKKKFSKYESEEQSTEHISSLLCAHYNSRCTGRAFLLLSPLFAATEDHRDSVIYSACYAHFPSSTFQHR